MNPDPHVEPLFNAESGVLMRWTTCWCCQRFRPCKDYVTEGGDHVPLCGECYVEVVVAHVE